MELPMTIFLMAPFLKQLAITFSKLSNNKLNVHCIYLFARHLPENNLLPDLQFSFRENHT